MVILQIDFEKHSPEEMELIANQVRNVCEDERVLVIPTDVNFIHELTIEQLQMMKTIVEKEIESREDKE